ncbi:hypothetical protein [Actinoallomurus vinaceus]|uniref:hypothetical protein n=1 Tax=Actinoallomurus vinaceus TaxID=1080074 RepID=UPI0031EFC955
MLLEACFLGEDLRFKLSSTDDDAGLEAEPVRLLERCLVGCSPVADVLGELAGEVDQPLVDRAALYPVRGVGGCRGYLIV